MISLRTKLPHGFVGLLILVALFVFCGASYAKTVTIKISHQFAKGDVRDQMARVFGDMVTEKTNGEVKFRYYPSRSLYKPKEQWDAMRKGALDMSVFPLDYASGKVPQFSITLMPCVVTNLEQGLSWQSKPIGKEIESLMEENGVKNLLWAWFDGGIGSKVKQIKVPADVKGAKLRAAGKKFEYMMSEAGASITSMPSSEAYHGLATGVLDSLLTSSASFVSYRLYEVLNYINVPKDYAIWHMANNLSISMKTWNKLSPSQQIAFNETAEWMRVNWVYQNVSKLTDNLVKQYGAAKVEMYNMTELEFNEWKQLAKDTSWKNFSETVPDGEKYLKLANEAME